MGRRGEPPLSPTDLPSPATPAADPITVRPPGRWLLLSGLIAVYLAFGVITTSIAPMLTMVQVDLGASRSQMGFVLGAWALMFIATAPLAGRFIDRFGLTRALLIGGISITASAAARSVATDVTTLWLAVSVFGLGGPLISAGAPTLVRTWFGDPGERRRAVSAYAIAPGLGGVL
ncbi:MAG: MFS transporter, partial [Actinomycetota bacterium]